MKNKYMVLRKEYIICSYANSKYHQHINHVYVKEYDFFVSQDGNRETWGQNWVLIFADSIESARKKVQKYTSEEWEYEINLSPEEKEIRELIA